MNQFQSIVKDIEQIKIQGATNVAKSASKALDIVFEKYKDDPKGVFYHLNQAKQILLKTRPTEPAMQNVINYLFSEDILNFSKRQKDVKNHFLKAEEKIASIGAKKIVDGKIIFTHCHSSSVIDILKKAKKERKRFKVYNTETRPLFQGRLTARELSRAGISVTHFVDSAARLALKEADMMLIGADAISSEGDVFNKIGSEMFAEIAEKYNVPVYVCTDSWKFDPKSVFGFDIEIERRRSKEVWPTAPSGVRVDNRAFEKVNSNLINGIISELGIYSPEIFAEEVKTAYPWMF